MEVVELLKELIKRQSVTPNECGIYDIIKAELADFEAIEIEKNGVKNLFLYKDFSVDCHDSAFAESRNDENIKNQNANSSIVSEKSGLCSHEQGNKTKASIDEASGKLPDFSPQDEFATKPHLCFAGHIDVVPAGFGWSVPPFDALIKNGVLYGRGAQDMKGGVAAFVSALQKVKHFNGILSVLLTSDEEGDGIFGTKIMLERLKECGLLPHFAIVAEPTCEKKLGDSIKIGRRGSVNGVLKIYGTQGHAAYPHKCVNPLDLIAPILTQISGKDLDSGSEYFAPSKIVITDIRGGIEATNVTPAELKLMFNVRNNPLTDKNAIQNYVESLLKSAGIQKYDLSFSQSAFPFVGVESRVDSADSQNLDKNNRARSAHLLKASSGVGEGVVREGEGSDFAIQAPAPSLKKNARGEKWDSDADLSAQGRKEIDSAESQNGLPREQSSLAMTNFLDSSPIAQNYKKSSADSAILFNTLCNAIYKKTHITPRPNTEGGTSDARYFSAFGVEVVEFGLVNDRIHAVDECVNLRDLETLRDIFVDFIADFDSAIHSNRKNSSIVSEKSGLCSHERGNKTKASMVASLHSQILRIDEASGKLPDLSPQDEFTTQ